MRISVASVGSGPIGSARGPGGGGKLLIGPASQGRVKLTVVNLAGAVGVYRRKEEFELARRREEAEGAERLLKLPDPDGAVAVAVDLLEEVDDAAVVGLQRAAQLVDHRMQTSSTDASSASASSAESSSPSDFFRVR